MGSPESINSSGLHVRLTIRISVLQWDGRKALCGFFLEPIYRSTAYDCYRIEKRHLNHFVWKRIWEKPGFLEKPGFFLKAWFCGTNLGLSRKPWKFSWTGRSRYIYIIYRDIYFFIYVYIWSKWWSPNFPSFVRCFFQMEVIGKETAGDVVFGRSI